MRTKEIFDLSKCKPKLNKLIIPEGTKKLTGHLSEDFFTYSVTFPSTLKEIPEGCFKDDYMLEEVVFNEGLEKIGDNAFSDTFIKSVTFPSTLKSIGENAFKQTGIEELILTKNIKTIGKSAFESCRLKNLILEDGGLTSIPQSAFSFNQDLTNIVIPNSIEFIENNAFSSCDVTHISFGTGLKSIGDFAFDCDKMKSLFIPSTIKECNSFTFGIPNKDFKCRIFVSPNLKKEIIEDLQYTYKGLVITRNDLENLLDEAASFKDFKTLCTTIERMQER